MRLTYAEIMSYGFRIGRDVPQATVELAIETAELYYVQQSMGGDDYADLVALDDTAVLIAGGLFVDVDGHKHHVAGFKKGVAHIAYAELLRMNINATTFGSVQKNDEYSENVNPLEQIKYFLAVGTQFVREVCELGGYGYHPTTGVSRESYFTTKRKEGGWR